MRWRPLFVGLAMLAAPVGSALAEQPGWFPFVIPAEDSGRTAVHVGALHSTPAGAAGFLQARDGKLVDGKGQRVRLLGVNLVFRANFPEKAEAVQMAARLHRFGINVVRLHHMDFFHAPRGIFDPKFKDMQHLDKGQLDRLDHLVYQLKQHGIYTNVNLHVSRGFTAADGFQDTEELPRLGKVVGYYEPRMIELQKKYARDLLDRVNPYTKLRYTEDPAIAVIELNNEDTLLGEAWGPTVNNLPSRYRAELARQWNLWLQERYRSTAALRTAWKAEARPVGGEILANGEFTAGSKGWYNEQHGGARSTLTTGGDLPAGVKGKVLKITLERLGEESWHLQLSHAGLDLRDGEVYTLRFHARADRSRKISVGASIAADDYHNIGLQEEVNLARSWQPFQFVFTAGGTVEKKNRISFGLGQATGTIELAGVSLRPGGGTLSADVSLEKGTVPLLRPSASPAGSDWIAFLIDVEKRYLVGLREYIQNDLKSRSLVLCSQASYGGLGGALRETHADFTDMHAYWEHPHFPRRAWDPNDWIIRNTPMVRHPAAGTMPGLAQYRLAGRAFTVSEYNHPAPGDYQVECVPLLAAFAAWQDWDGIYLFDYTDDGSRHGGDRLRNFFSIDNNPAKLALLPAAAMLFLRGDLAPARASAELRVPAGSVPALMAKQGQYIGSFWSSAGSRPAEVLTHRLAVRFTEGTGKPTVQRLGTPASPAPLRLEGGKQALFTADAAASKLFVGFVAGRTLQADGWKVVVPEKAPPFAALALSARDGKPTGQSRSLLLTAVGRVENLDMGWNENRTSVGNRWGKGPVQAQGIPATVTLATSGKAVTVHALDPAGKRRTKIEARVADGQATFAIGPDQRTLWYEIVIDE